MPTLVSVFVMVFFFVFALLGMLIFGLTLVATGVVTLGGSAWAISSTDKESGLSPIANPEKRNNFLGKFGLTVAGGGTIALLAFGMAFISIIGFICSAVINLVIWIPYIFSSFGITFGG